MSEQSQHFSSESVCGVQLQAQTIFPFFCGTHIVIHLALHITIFKIVLIIHSIYY